MTDGKPQGRRRASLDRRYAGTRQVDSAGDPRSRQSRRQIIDAALELLGERGFAGFSMDGLAQHAAVSKATIYRFWPSRVALLIEASEVVAVPPTLPTNGNLRNDLTNAVEALNRTLTNGPQGAVLTALADGAERDPELAKLQRALIDTWREPFRSRLAKAVAEGQLNSHTDVEVAVDLLVGPSFYRRLVSRQPTGKDLPGAVVEAVLKAFA
jgi:AcrR family transcriptional regulator